MLVANAGPFVEHRFGKPTDRDWIAAFTGNVLSAVGCARALIPAMRRRGWGQIITIGTRGVATLLPNMVEYSAAKAALVNATGALARELAGTAITANVVTPGVILTPGLRTMFQERARSAGDQRSWEELEPEVLADYAPNPVGRLGRCSALMVEAEGFQALLAGVGERVGVIGQGWCCIRIDQRDPTVPAR